MALNDTTIRLCTVDHQYLTFVTAVKSPQYLGLAKMPARMRSAAMSPFRASVPLTDKWEHFR